MTAVAAFATGLAAAGAGCGAASRGPSAAASSARASSAPLQVQPSQGASPIDVVTRAGSCTIATQTALGASYRFAPARQPDVVAGLSTRLQACLAGASGTHGTAHVAANVARDGKLSSVAISPGGALSTRVAACLRERLEGAVLAPAEDGATELLLFVVSDCGEN